MKSRYFPIAAIIAFCLILNTYGQEITQVIRGRIVDAESQNPISFATISVQTTRSSIGTTSDEYGSFRLEKVPVGRHYLQVSFVGFETKVIPELMVTSGKEVVLNIGLKEKITRMEEVVVKAYAKKDKPINSMATVSARTFSVEEAQRYAGGFDDPARLEQPIAPEHEGVSPDHVLVFARQRVIDLQHGGAAEANARGPGELEALAKLLLVPFLVVRPPAQRSPVLLIRGYQNDRLCRHSSLPRFKAEMKE